MTSNGSKPNDPLDQVDEAIGKLEGTQWDEDSQVTHIEAENVYVDNTGKFKAVEGPTKPDNPAPSSNVLQKAADAGTSVITKVNNPYALAALVVLVVGALVAYGLRLRFG